VHQLEPTKFGNAVGVRLTTTDDAFIEWVGKHVREEP